MKPTRGAIDLVVLLVVGLVSFGVYEYKTVFAPGRNKAKTDQAAVAAAATAQQAAAVNGDAAAVKVAVAQATADHAVVIAKRDEIDRNAAGFIEGARQAISANPEPSDADIVAIGLLDSATASLGQPLTAEQKAVWTKTVSALIAKNAAAQAKIAQMTTDAAALRASLNATQEHAKASDAQAQTLSAQLAANAKELTATATQAATLTADVKRWADKEPDMWARLKAALVLVVLLIGGIAWYEIKRKGLSGALQDAVALKEHVETTAAKLGADAQALKQSADEWWADDPKARRIFEDAKAKLRL